MAGRVLQLLGTHDAAARHVALLTDELEVAGWHVEVAGPRGAMAVHGHLDHIVDIATAGERLAHRHLRTLTGAVDLVHAHGRDAARIAIDAGLRLPVVGTWYADEPTAGARHDRRQSRHLAAVIAATPALASICDERARVAVIRPALGPPRPQRSRSEVRAALGIDGSQPVVLCYGPLIVGAGLDAVIDAAIFLQQEAPALRIAIVGSGPLERHLRLRIAELGLSQTVSVSVPNALAADILAAGDLIVMPSASRVDESVVLDAMALERPVVITAAGIPEGLIVAGETGSVVPAGHGRALASTIADLFAHPATMAALAARGRVHVEALHDVDVLIDAVVGVYGGLLARR
ncbi:MAG: glycosyltransferase family 4 protein [Acidimicrobiales bacterium]